MRAGSTTGSRNLAGLCCTGLIPVMHTLEVPLDYIPDWFLGKILTATVYIILLVASGVIASPLP